jgi:alkylation response protein AidB-like acyl-CoA dehydrogenase
MYPPFDPVIGPVLDDDEERRLRDVRAALGDLKFGDDHPEEGLRRLVEGGFLTETVPARYGGKDRSLTFAARVIEEVAAFSPALGWLVTIQYGLHFLLPTITGGAPDPYFREVVSRGALLAGGHGRTNLRTARGDNGDLLISGVLRYCSGAPIASWISSTVTLAENGGADPDSVVFFRPSEAGVKCETSDSLHSMRGSLTGLVHLSDVRVDARDIHPFTDLSDAASRPEHCRYFGGWQSLLLQNAVFLGAARGALDTATGPLVRKAARDNDPAAGALMSLALGSAGADLLTARGVYYARIAQLEAAAGRGEEQANADHPGHAVVLGTVADLAFQVIAGLMQQAGGSALLATNPLERYWRDVQLARVAEGNRPDHTRHQLGGFLAAAAGSR